jgi:excisionase family DNA binding protein
MLLTEGVSQTLMNRLGKTLLRVGEAAELLSVSRWTIYRWVEEGRLRGTKIGKGSLRIFRESIVALIENNENDIAGPSTTIRRL